MKWSFHPITQFSDFREDWKKLNLAGPKTPLLDLRFVEPCIEFFSSGSEKIAVCQVDKGIIAIAIIFRKKMGSWETFQASQSPLGYWLHDSSYSIDELLDTLQTSIPGICLLFGITQQDPELLVRPPPSKRLRTVDYIQTAKISIGSDWEAYWSGRGKNLRHNLNKQRNRLNKAGIEMQVIEITSPEDMKDAVRQYGEIESAGWKQTAGTAVSISNAQGRFYTKLLGEFATSNNARVYQLLLNGKVAAVDLCIDDGETFIILKTTYDETYNSSSPALLMRKVYFEEFFNHKRFKSIEFYGKVMEWHKKWSSNFRQMYHVNYLSRFISKFK
ncbi:MAG: GNAT family N-acetyltransferase [Gammaproteobacteria bacterium]|jgi:hypothetical protein